MRITEIERRHGGGIILDGINRQGEKKIGSVQSYTLFKDIIPEGDLFYLVDTYSADTNPFAAIAGNIINIGVNNYFQIINVMVDGTYRGNKIGSDMYNFIMHYTKMNLMSDIAQSLDGEKLWKTINKTHTVKVLDLKTQKIVSNNPEDAYNDDDYVLVTDNKISESILIPTYTKREN